MKYKIVPLFLVGMLAACQWGKTQEEQMVEQTPAEEPVGPTTHRMPVYDFADTVTAGGKLYRYAIHRHAVDSLPPVKDEWGDTYVDNMYALSITCGGKAVFSHTYTKRGLQAHLSPDFVKQGIIDGFRFYRTEGANLVFGLCVSYPDSDLSARFLLTITPSGHATICKDNTPEVELMDQDEAGV